MLALVGGAFGNGSAQAAATTRAANAATTLTIEGLEGANALDVQSFSWGIENPVTTGTGGGGAGTGKAKLSEFNLVFVTSVQHTGGANGVVERLSLTYGSVQIESV